MGIQRWGTIDMWPEDDGEFVSFTDHERVVRTANGTEHALRTTLGWLEDEFEKMTAALAASRDEVEELRGALMLARNELAGLPHSLGYSFTHLPKIDAALEKRHVNLPLL